MIENTNSFFYRMTNQITLSNQIHSQVHFIGTDIKSSLTYHMWKIKTLFVQTALSN